MTDALEIPPGPVDLATFLTWAEAQPRGRFELLEGEIVAMSPERARHSLTKQEVALTLREAVRRAGLDCTVYPDGMTVVIDDTTAYEPDAMVACLPPDLDSLVVEDPLIVVEVTSPSNSRVDMTIKLADYFRVPSIRHYLIVQASRRLLIHHWREGDEIATRLISEGRLHLDPPGLELDVADLFFGDKR